MSNPLHSPVKHSPLVEALAETREQVAGMEQRILRQHKRIERVLTIGVGPIEDMRALLADMVHTRDLMQSQVVSLEDEQAGAGNAEASRVAKRKG